MSDPLRLVTLHGLVSEVYRNGIDGDIVECGVCNGGSAGMMAAAVEHNLDRRIWLYDTFEGIPAPGSQDGDSAQAFAGQFVGSVESVREVFRKVRCPTDLMIVRKGPFRESFKDSLPKRVALLHIDGDWYDSVLCALETFYPIVADGGFVVLDDFGHWEGARKAYYAFCRTAGLEPLLERVGYTQAFWRKGQEHNRDSQCRYQCGYYQPRAK